MKTLPEKHWEALEFEGDIRWELAQRVIESPHLIGSVRLRDFLLHVTTCAIRETPEDATEQQIGIQVFQRSPGFNSSETASFAVRRAFYDLSCPPTSTPRAHPNP